MSSIITVVFAVALLLVGLYATLRFVSPKAGEFNYGNLALAWIAFSLAVQNGTIPLVVLVGVAFFRPQAAKALQSCGITRESFETIAKGVIAKVRRK